MISRRVESVLNDPPTPILPLLIFFSLVYRVFAAIHRGIYRAGLFKVAVLPRPVVCIGNLSVGGGGKTPLVMWLARKMREEGRKPAILTRGFGRRDKEIRIVASGDDWKSVGDEPSLMASRLEEVPVVVSRDRYRSGMEVLRNRDVDVFILDDGFGHHALKKDLELVVIDDYRRFGNGRMLPAGILREPPARLKDAGIVIVTKATIPDQSFRKQIGKHSDAPVLWAEYRPDRLVQIEEEKGDGLAPVGKGPFLGFCGIADPGSFERSLEGSGIKAVDVLSFPDHHPYTFSDVRAIEDRAAVLGARALVTTEKDATRWPGGDGTLPCFALTMEVVFLEGGDVLMDTVNSVISRTEK